MTLMAAIQMNSTEDRKRNEAQARHLIRSAAAAGAAFIALPENADQIAPRELRIAQAETVDGPLVGAYRQLAQECRIWLLLGSFAERAPCERLYNTSVLIGPAGDIAATYRKIHLFDANPPDGVPYRESETVVPGTDVVTVETPLATIGLSVCYDLRFPELYRIHSTRGATVMTVPSAFTVPTGQAHWETLLRARAIENLAYVIAPAQTGEHGHRRRSYGHAMIVDPWGVVAADAGDEGPCFVLAPYDPGEIDRRRSMLPALNHRRI